MIYKVISNALDVIRSNAFNVLERVIGQYSNYIVEDVISS